MISNKRGSSQKRKNDNDQEPTKVGFEKDASPTVILFKSYQMELDAKYDKHERLVKKSRDVTIESKRIIFLLHRVTSSKDNERILVEANQRIATLYTTVIQEMLLELNKREVYQFLRAFTGGLQEFIEAVSFYHYLRYGYVIGLEEVYNRDFLEDSMEYGPSTKPDLPFPALLTPVEYVLGIADLTGELMRKCINSVAAGDMNEPFKLSALLQNIYKSLLVCGNYSKDLKRKLVTLRSSLTKVENACYTIRIRGTEFPKHIITDLFSTEDPEDIEI